jgi:hypothetical protein
MSHWGIPVDRSCGSYRPGHRVHWIHAKKASEKDQPLINVSITFRGYGWVDIDNDDFALKLWTHKATRLRQASDTCEHAVWKATMAHSHPARPVRVGFQHGHVGPANTVR